MSRPESSKRKLIELGMNVASSDMYSEDLVWSEYSNDKSDIAEVLMEVIRSLFKSLPLSRKLSVLSIGSGSEPQFKILEAAFQGGINLLDIDGIPLEQVKKTAKNSSKRLPNTIQEDYTAELLSAGSAQQFRKKYLSDRKQDFVTLHHSLYYCKLEDWKALFKSLYAQILREKGSIHAVMMASACENRSSTTWLYNHFAGKFANSVNKQNLSAFAEELAKTSTLPNARIEGKTRRVDFWVNDFEKFMAVVWMILLYPDVHDYTDVQKEEITEHVYSNFWITRQPLIQLQNHLVVSRCIGE